MKIHEYQAKGLFRKFGVPVPESIICHTPDEVFRAAQNLSGTVVVKSQIHAGGRGKGKIYSKSNPKELLLSGGVHVVKSAEEAKNIAAKIFGNLLVTHQTGPQGKTVKTVLVEKGSAIQKEYYLGLVLDRAISRITVMTSAEGGMEIEEVAARYPHRILKAAVDPAVGFQAFQGRRLGFGLGLSAGAVKEFTKLCQALYRLYWDLDASVVEVNPLVLTKGGNLLAVDAKIDFDENALFRHEDFLALKDVSEEDEQEIAAHKHQLSYVAMNGNIGCMVNGAGLAMATMDIIKLHGGEPANFLDVGGGASAEKVTAAFKIILKDPNVRAILINIFGGIMRCDVIAEGVVAAVRELGLHLPLVVRLQGTNVDIGQKILAESGMKIVPADTMADAARKAVEAIGVGAGFKPARNIGQV